MQFINKRNRLYEEPGNKIVTDFIEGQWQEDADRYINLNYESFEHTAMVNLTRSEQSDLCCYCMRTLTDKNITLEHVIPNKTKDQVTFDKYTHIKVLKDNLVLWTNKYIHSKQTLPPFPHFIAYQNLVASCNGELIITNENERNPETTEAITLHQCCNNRRGSEYIEPLFFYEDVGNLITYSKSGDILYDDEFENTITILNLNHDSLVLMRKAWFEIGKEYSIEAVNSALLDDEKRLDILDDIDLDVNLKETLEKEIYWNLLFQYKWFYSYYKN